MLTEIFLLVLLVCLVFLARFRDKPKLPKTYPKGPPGWPLVGNLFQVGSKPHFKLAEWSRQYGAVYSLTMYKTRAVVLNSYTVLSEAMVDRRTDFAGRPRDLLTWEISTYSKDIGLMDYSERLLAARKAFHAGLRVYGTEKWRECITTEVDKLIDKFVESGDTPIDPDLPLSLAAFNAVSTLLQGQTYNEDNQEFQNFLKSNKTIFAGLIGVALLDYVRWLEPLFKQQIKELKEASKVRVQYMEDRVKTRRATFDSGDPPRDAIDVMLTAQHDYQTSHPSSDEPFDDIVLVQLCMDYLGAGSETVVSAMQWFLLEMVLHPEVQAKIHKELDDVIGNDRRPDYDDHNDLHYLHASLYETMRLHTILLLSIYHRTQCDSSVNGCEIPQDTLIIPNNWAIDHDPDVFKDPHVFTPERFIDPETGKCVSTNEMNFAPFGMGRRVCLGEMFAKMEYFLMAANLLHQFEVTNPPNQEMPSTEGILGMTHHPIPFKIVMKKRKCK